ncbi:hypothetical protein [Ralstonia pseudosolanacearum]|uniref:Uncharacterized protein n=1 Tax=Ralstonia solanacearum TaxID=305 RepID=A0AA92IFN4_RALSL|nr:hypothetical protein [Ralstonia pseudosolanacearum]QCX51180.1 hypothetical protein E7Z57_18940 [Ralstonia pseudosolanacearum]
MSVRRNCLLPLAAAAAFLACGAATAASVSEQALSPLQAHGARDPYTDGARGTRDPYTDGGAQAEAMLQASVGPRDPYSDGGMSHPGAPRDRDPYTDGAQAA